MARTKAASSKKPAPLHPAASRKSINEQVTPSTNTPRCIKTRSSITKVPIISKNAQILKEAQALKGQKISQISLMKAELRADAAYRLNSILEMEKKTPHKELIEVSTSNQLAADFVSQTTQDESRIYSPAPTSEIQENPSIVKLSPLNNNIQTIIPEENKTAATTIPMPQKKTKSVSKPKKIPKKKKAAPKKPKKKKISEEEDMEGLVISKGVFKEQVDAILEEIKTDVNFCHFSYETLQTAAEDYLLLYFEFGSKCMVHAKRKTFLMKDVILLKDLRKVVDFGKESYINDQASN